MSDQNGSDSEERFTPYATRVAVEAANFRRRLPVEIQLAIFEAMHELAEDPHRYPHRIFAVSRDRKTLVYRHPSPAVEITFEIDGDEIYFSHFVAPVLQPPRHLFLSYSHQDLEWFLAFRELLRPLEESQLVRIWADTEIMAGDRWRDEIEKSLREARVALLLVSNHFVRSTFIAREELPVLLDQATRVGVLILWVTLTRMQGINAKKRRELQQRLRELKEFEAVNNPAVPLATLAGERRQQALVRVFERVREAIKTRS